jgi:hypothetical protein
MSKDNMSDEQPATGQDLSDEAIEQLRQRLMLLAMIGQKILDGASTAGETPQWMLFIPMGQQMFQHWISSAPTQQLRDLLTSTLPTLRVLSDVDWTSDASFEWLCDGLEAIKASQKEGKAFDASALWPPPANVFIGDLPHSEAYFRAEAAAYEKQHPVQSRPLQDET